MRKCRPRIPVLDCSVLPHDRRSGPDVSSHGAAEWAVIMGGNSVQRVDRALLIGVDCYEYIRPNLGGCVGDVNQLHDLLVAKLGTRPEQIVKLTSSMEHTEEPSERATRDNIIDGIKHLADVAQPGKQIYIHYSGHGMRNDTTILPGVESDGRDEAIAPADSGDRSPAGYYILDKELGWLIRQITDKGAFITVVLDCCHSASGTRAISGPGSSPEPKVRRGWMGSDPRPRTDANLVAPIDQLRAVVTAAAGTTGSLLPTPKNYVLMTACRERETAKEYETNGVFTFFMLEHLKTGLAGLTYRGLQDRIGGSIRALASGDQRYDAQTPQLEGNGNLVVFGGGIVAEPNALSANLQTDGTILVPGAGNATGVVAGTTLGLYPPGTVDFADHGRQIGVATVQTVRPDAAICQVPPDVPRDKLVPGMRAIIIRPGVAKIRRRVALIGGSELDTLRRAIATSDGDGLASPFLELVGDDGRPELSVVVAGGDYVIRDQRDQPLPRISPLIADGQAGAAAKALRRLEHIVQYRNAWDLHNGDEASALRNALAISVTRVTARSAGKIGLRQGDRIAICVHNRSATPVSAALLYFSPAWSITRIWPDGETAYSELGRTSDDGFEVQLMEASLPPGVASSIDRLKLFATQNDRPTSFDTLRLDALDLARVITKGRMPGPRNELEALLESVRGGVVARELICVARTGDWGTAELELETSAG